MKSISSLALVILVCLLTSAAPADPPKPPGPSATPGKPAAPAPPETLKLADLVNRPDRWPALVTLKRDFDFTGGLKASTGQQVHVLKFDGQEVQVDDGHDLTFGISPEDCDLLDAANKAWAALTPAQRAVDPATLMQDGSLWPDKVTCLSGFNLQSGVNLPSGGEFEFVTLSRDGVHLYTREHNANLVADLGQTDMIARARKRALIEPDKRSSRIVEALRQGLVDSGGKGYTSDSLGSAKVFALYYGASWCMPCRRFSPGFVKYIDSVLTENPRLAVVMMSNDKEVPKMLSYMQQEKMPWPALPLESLNKSPIFLGYVGGGIPQLVIVDRHGKVLANSFEGSRNLGPESAMQALKKIIDSGAAK